VARRGVESWRLTGQTEIELSNGATVSNSANWGVSGHLRLFNPGGSLYQTFKGGFKYFNSSSTSRYHVEVGGAYESATAINGLRFYFSSGNFTGTIRIYAVAKQAGTGGWTEVVAATDQDIASSTTLADDNELRFDMAAGGFYFFEAFLMISSPAGGATPDFKLTLTGPATLSGWYVGSFAGASGGANGAAFNTFGGTEAVGTQTTMQGCRIHGCASSTGGGTGASGFRLQWAQNTSNASATRRHSGSVLRYRRLV
jgi:hypothetical protein